MIASRCCSKCGREIPSNAKPNKEYVLLGLEFYHRACYLVYIGVMEAQS
ncbi:hypothetical protein [uncultured Methanomethylovorans sp.]|nr:hypothetical protein [uncultured Methanomethylovorans sp.]